MAGSTPTACSGTGELRATTDEPTPIAAPFVKIPWRVLEDQRLSSMDVRVFGAVRTFDWTGGGCWAGQEKLCARAGGIHKRTLRKALKNLQACGYLTVIPGAPGEVNHYYILEQGDAGGAQECPTPGYRTTLP